MLYALQQFAVMVRKGVAQALTVEQIQTDIITEVGFVLFLDYINLLASFFFSRRVVLQKSYSLSSLSLCLVLLKVVPSIC